MKNSTKLIHLFLFLISSQIVFAAPSEQKVTNPFDSGFFIDNKMFGDQEIQAKNTKSEVLDGKIEGISKIGDKYFSQWVGQALNDWLKQQTVLEDEQNDLKVASAVTGDQKAEKKGTLQIEPDHDWDLNAFSQWASGSVPENMGSSIPRSDEPIPGWLRQASSGFLEKEDIISEAIAKRNVVREVLVNTLDDANDNKTQLSYVTKESTILPNTTEDLFSPETKTIQHKPQSEVIVKSSNVDGLQTCTDFSFGVRFLCNPDWVLQTEEDAMLIIISESEPTITLTVAKTGTNVTFVEQLNKKLVQEMGQYADGFVMDYKRFANQKALKIKAFSKDFPEMRLLDYYFVRDDDLHSILFSVDPKESWSQYAPLVYKIAESFEIL